MIIPVQRPLPQRVQQKQQHSSRDSCWILWEGFSFPCRPRGVRRHVVLHFPASDEQSSVEATA